MAKKNNGGRGKMTVGRGRERERVEGEVLIPMATSWCGGVDLMLRCGAVLASCRVEVRDDLERRENKLQHIRVW